MLTETGRVMAIEDDKVWLETIRTSACESCRAKQVCGQKVLSSWAQDPSHQQQKNYLYVHKDFDVEVGDEVTIGIPESSFIQGALVMYMVPLLGLILSALVARLLFVNLDALVIFFSVLGFIISFILARSLARRLEVKDEYRPKMLSVAIAAVQIHS